VPASPALARSPAARPTPIAPAAPAPSDKLAFAGILAATFLTYASTIPFGWAYDDPAQIVNNPDLRWGRLGYLFSHQLWAYLSGSDARFYRPVLSLWLLLNKSIFGLNAPAFHLTTVLAHVAATALAYVLARRLLRSSTAALVTAGIFGLHPLHVETAAWISDVNDSLAAVFCFAAFLGYLNARTRSHQAKLWWAVSLACYGLGLLTKEIVILLPVIILADAATRRLPGRIRTVAVILISYGALALAYMALRASAIGAFVRNQQPASLGQALLTAPSIALFYLFKIILPLGLSAHYDPMQAASAASWSFVVPAAALAGVAAGAIVAYRWWRRTGGLQPRAFAVALAWIAVPILPALNLALLVDRDPLHDRYAYISVFGVALAAASIWLVVNERWPAAIHLARPIFLTIVVMMAFGSAIQSQYWASDSALFARAVTLAPANPWAHWNYGAALSSRGRYAQALPEFAQSYELAPDFRTAAYAGFAAEQLQRWPEAEEWYRRSLHLNQQSGEAWFQMGHVFLAEQRPAHAIPYLKRAVQLAPAAAGYHYDLAAALEQSGRDGEALDEYMAEVAAHPEQAAAQAGVARLQARLRLASSR